MDLIFGLWGMVELSSVEYTFNTKVDLGPFLLSSTENEWDDKQSSMPDKLFVDVFNNTDSVFGSVGR